MASLPQETTPGEANKVFRLWINDILVVQVYYPTDDAMVYEERIHENMELICSSPSLSKWEKADGSQSMTEIHL